MARRTLVVAPFALALFALAFAATGTPGAEIGGQVYHSKDGPIAGATVIIWSGKAAEGPSMLCPTCYPDCGRQAVTDAGGRFHFEETDPDTAYTLVVLSQGYSVASSPSAIMPGRTDVAIELEVRPPSPQDPRRRLRGQVVDLDGNPIQDAIVRADMYMFLPKPGDLRGGSSHIDGAERLAVTDADGFFELRSAEPILGMDLSAFAPLKARARAFQAPTDGPETTIALGPGATVRGRLLKPEGTPAAGATVGLASVERSLDAYEGEYEVGTDDNGYFELQAIPAQVRFRVYTPLDAPVSYGSLASQEMTTPAHGQTVSLGELRLDQSVSLSGTVKLTDGAPLHGSSFLIVGREGVFDPLIHKLPPDGSFSFEGLPADVYTLRLSVQGYRLTADNASRSDLDETLVGRIDADMRLLITLEPGRPDDRTRIRLEDQPLRGAESADSEARNAATP